MPGFLLSKIIHICNTCDKIQQMPERPMTEKELPTDLHFDALYGEATYATEEYAKINAKSVKTMLEQSIKDIGSGKTYTSEELFAELDGMRDYLDERIELEHQDWIRKQQELPREYNEVGLVEYLWENKPQKEDPLYYQQWRFILLLLKTYSRIAEKFPDAQFYAVSKVLYSSTPYSEEGTLPLVLIRSDHGEVYLMLSDPVADTFLVFTRHEKFNKAALSLWLNDRFRESFKRKLIESTPDQIQALLKEGQKPNELFTGDVSDLFDLHGLICSVLS